MPNPSSWVFRRGVKWHSGWRDENGRCHSKAHAVGAGKALALDYARSQAIEACQLRAGQSIRGKEVQTAVVAFFGRENVKACTHELNRRHLTNVITHFKLRTIDQIDEGLVNEWLGHLKTSGCNSGGQSLSLRILRTFCRFCRKKRWMIIDPFENFKIPKSDFSGRYLSDEERTKLLSINPRYPVDHALHCALTFGLYSLLRISQVFNAEWGHFKTPDQLWVPGIKGQEGRWITLHPKALEMMGERRESGRIFDFWDTLPAFREAVYKKAKREKLHGVRFHDTKHTGISALLEAGYSVPEVCKISGNSYRTIVHYAHVNEQRVFDKWKGFEYRDDRGRSDGNPTAAVQRKMAEKGPEEGPTDVTGTQGENAKPLYFSTNSSL
jgi:integrase